MKKEQASSIALPVDGKESYVLVVLEDKPGQNPETTWWIYKYTIDLLCLHTKQNPESKEMPFVHQIIFDIANKKQITSPKIWEFFKSPELMKDVFMNGPLMINLDDVNMNKKSTNNK